MRRFCPKPPDSDGRLHPSVRRSPKRPTVPANASRDDDTVATPTRGEKGRAPEGHLTEKTLRFRYPPMTSCDHVAPFMLHVHWMCAVQEAFGEAVQFFDNKNRRVPKIDPIRLDPTLIKAHFVWYSQAFKQNPTVPVQTQATDRRTTKYLLHCIRTSCSISEIKANSKVRELLTLHNF